MHDVGTSCLAKLQIRTPSTPRRINLSIPAFVPRTDATSLLSAQSGPARCLHECPLSGVKRHRVDAPRCPLMTQSGHPRVATAESSQSGIYSRRAPKCFSLGNSGHETEQAKDLPV